MIAAACALFLASQTLTAADLERAGVVRLGDLFRLADGWTSSSIEGFTIDASPAGFEGGGAPGYAIVIDGVLQEFAILGTSSPNRLPLPVEMIDHVTIESKPTLVRGRFAPAVVSITSRRPAARIQLRARHVAGSEAGDPGPFQFTGDTTPNVERFGFESSATLGGRGGSFWSDASFVRARHYASDEAILSRWTVLGVDDLHVIEKKAPSLRIGVDAPRVSFTGFARASTIDEVFFPRALGREIPVESAFKSWGGRAEWRPGTSRSPSFDASLTSTTNEIDASEREGEPALDWKKTSSAADFRARWERGAQLTELGVRALYHEVAAGERPLRGDSWTRGGVFARLAARASADETVFDLALDRGRGGATYAIVFSRTRRAIDFSIAAAKTRGEEAAPFWYWRERGLSAIDEAGLAAGSRGDVQGSSFVGGDLGITVREGSRFDARLGTFARRHRDLALEELRVGADSLGFPIATSATLHPQEEGTIAGASATASLHIARGIDLRGSWRFQDAALGSNLFRDTARQNPKHVGRVALAASWGASFHAEIAVRARSSAVWLAFAEASRVPTTFADADLPGWVAADISFSKWFAHRRLRAGLAFRDLLDRPLRTHPIGEVERLTVVAQAEVAL